MLCSVGVICQVSGGTVTVPKETEGVCGAAAPVEVAAAATGVAPETAFTVTVAVRACSKIAFNALSSGFNVTSILERLSVT